MSADLRIGATVDTSALQQGMAASVEEIQSAARKIPLVFDECRSKTKAALDGISAEVKRNAETVNITTLKVAEATKAYNRAVTDLRRATLVSRDAKVDDASSSALLASAQQKVAATSLELASAKETEAARVAEASEAESLSQEGVAGAFRRLAASVTESTAQINERLVSVAETGGLSAEGLEAGFGGVGKLLGAGIAVGFAANYLDGLAKMNVELDHLHVETGMNMQSLAGLQQIVKESGADWQAVSTGLVRFQRAQVQASFGMIQYKRAFQELGITMEDLKNKTPERKLALVSEALARSTSSAQSADAALTLFGRGGIALVPVLKEQGAHLEANVAAAGALTGVTDESAEAARRWTVDTARLSAMFRGMLMPVLDHAEDVIRGVAAAFEAAAAVIVNVLDTVGGSVLSLVRAIGALAPLIYDAMTGDYSKLVSDTRNVGTQVASVWKGYFNDIRQSWQEVAHTLTGTTPLPPVAEGVDTGTDGLAPETRSRGAGRGHARAATTRGSGRETVANMFATAAVQAPDMSAAVNAFTQANDQIVRVNDETVQKNTEAWRLANDEKARLAQENYQQVAEDSAYEVRQGRMTAAQRVEILKQAAQQEYQIQLATIRAREVADSGDVVAYQRNLNRELELTRQHAQQMTQLNRQTNIQMEKGWEQTLLQMNQQFIQTIGQFVIAGQGFEQSMAQIMAGITENFTRNILQMAEQYLIGLMIQKSGQKQQIMADAKTAAANTYQAVSGIPVVGPVLAPVAAAAAFAGVMAFDSFDMGGVVGGGMGVEGIPGVHVPILAEQGERVLTPSQSRNFETLVNNRTTNTGGNTTLNASVEQHFHRGGASSARETQRAIQDLARRGRLTYA